MEQVKEDIDINKINEEVQRALEVAKKQLNSDEIRKSIKKPKKWTWKK